MEPPSFTNCPTQPIVLTVDQNGQLMAADFPLPQAVDNSGYISWVRVDPPKFRPPHFITKDMDVTYTAYDFAGNEANCKVRLRLPDTQAPLITCPNSYIVEAEQDIPDIRLYFNESTVDVKVHDVSNISEVFIMFEQLRLFFSKYIFFTDCFRTEGGFNKNGQTRYSNCVSSGCARKSKFVQVSSGP